MPCSCPKRICCLLFLILFYNMLLVSSFRALKLVFHAPPVRMKVASRFFSKEVFLRGKGISEGSTEVVVNRRPFNSFPFAYGEEIELQIDDLTNLGQGVGRTKLSDGSKWVVMVPLVLPGEVVKVRIYKNSASFSNADLVEVIKRSEHRVEPVCKYFSVCGGCQYQHINITSQRKWKESQVNDALTRIGKFASDTFHVNSMIGTDQLYGYRSKITPHYEVPRNFSKNKISRTRQKQLLDSVDPATSIETNGDIEVTDNNTSVSDKSDHEIPWNIGFHKRDTKFTVDIDQCVIATPAINKKYKQDRLDLFAFVNSDKTGKDSPTRGASWLFREGDHGEIVTNHKYMMTQTVNGITFKFKAGEFFQNNPYILPHLVDHVVRQATMDGECENLVDTYCGSGLFSLCASAKFKHVFGVEINPPAVDAATENAIANGITNAVFKLGKSEEIFKVVRHLRGSKTAVVVDPPRTGCDELFLNQLFRFAPQKIVYVSCDPATQARDARAIVDAGYMITDVTPFDLFPQTRHIENVITFAR
jgi:tRNA/tmRNA/rRNA uracil-C5-methylase (TrmA/RlmC/RlmD family)